MRSLQFVLAPLGLLLTLSILASFIGYGVLVVVGDMAPLPKLISKITLVLLLLSIFPLKRYLGFDWQALGFAKRSLIFKQFGQGLLLALLTLLPVLAFLYLMDIHVWDQSRVWTAGKIFEKVGLGLFFAMLIAVGEEILFRGLLFGALRKRFQIGIAIALSSFYYSALHFLKSSSQIAYPDLTPASGLILLREAYANWLNPEIVSAFLALWVVGVFLAVLRVKGGQSLGWCIGCHAGWVWQIKVSKDLLNVAPKSDYLWLVSNYDGVVGPLVAVWLTLALFAYWLLSAKNG